MDDDILYGSESGTLILDHSLNITQLIFRTPFGTRKILNELAFPGSSSRGGA